MYISILFVSCLLSNAFLYERTKKNPIYFHVKILQLFLSDWTSEIINKNGINYIIGKFVVNLNWKLIVFDAKQYLNDLIWTKLSMKYIIKKIYIFFWNSCLWNNKLLTTTIYYRDKSSWIYSFKEYKKVNKKNYYLKERKWNV